MKITNAKERAQFRTSPAWQLLRRYICASRNMTCEYCGVQYKRMADLNVHHMYETNYDNLAQDRFLLLCKTCHEKYTKAEFREAENEILSTLDYQTQTTSANYFLDRKSTL